MSMYTGSLGGDFDILAYAASGMEAQRGALEVASRNLALAQTATPDHPVKAYAPVYSTGVNSDNPFASLVRSIGDDDDTNDAAGGDDDNSLTSSDLTSAPGVGGAGLVAMTGVRKTDSDVNPITQMIDLINAQRAYESNASAFDLGKSVASKTIDLENQQ